LFIGRPFARGELSAGLAMPRRHDVIVAFVEGGAGNAVLETRELDKGMVDRFRRLKHPLLAVGEFWRS
jgi:hypothetical protein